MGCGFILLMKKIIDIRIFVILAANKGNSDSLRLKDFVLTIIPLLGENQVSCEKSANL